MNIADLQELVDDGIIRGDYVRSNIIFGGHHLINGYKAIPVLNISEHLVDDEDIELVEEDGSVIGYLCACKSLSEIEPSFLSEYKLIAYLTEIEKDKYGAPYKFSNDYVVIRYDKIIEYETYYLKSSSIWGGYQHPNTKINAISPFKYKPTNIVARKGLNIDTDEHQLAAFRSTVEPYSLERYLKLYHLLELSFDLDVVNKIKALGDDLKGIGQLLSNYQKDDISLLQTIINEKCGDIQAIEKKLNMFFDPSCNGIGVKVFFDYGKSSNPIKNDKTAAFYNLKNIGGISETNCKREKIAGSTVEYNKLVKNLAAYWIYRTRCCIAHNRFGEYIMTLDDEEFIVVFMEQLLREVLIQVFK